MPYITHKIDSKDVKHWKYKLFQSKLFINIKMKLKEKKKYTLL